MLNIVLIEPEIPNNTGNIGRLCVGTDCKLHLIHPLGFEISDKQLQRAGLDYWVHLNWYEYSSVEEWVKKVPDISRVFLFSANTEKSYLSASFQQGDWLVFGKESVGLSTAILTQFENHLTIPSTELIRSFNVSNTVAFAIGEARRQILMKNKNISI